DFLPPTRRRLRLSPSKTFFILPTWKAPPSPGLSFTLCVAALREAQLWRGQARTCRGGGGSGLPASAATKPQGGGGCFRTEECTTLPASEAVTAVTDYSSSSPLFFGRRVIQKIALTSIVDQADIETRGHSCASPESKPAGTDISAS